MAKFVFYAFGVLAIAAFALALSLPASASGEQQLSSEMFGLAQAIVALFFIYMFAKLFLSHI